MALIVCVCLCACVCVCACARVHFITLNNSDSIYKSILSCALMYEVERQLYFRAGMNKVLRYVMPVTLFGPPLASQNCHLSQIHI